MSTATRPDPPLLELLPPSVHGYARPDSPVPVAGKHQASSTLDAAAAAAAAPWTGREGSKPTLSTLPVEIAQMILARLDFSSLDSFKFVSRHSASLVSTLPENKALYKEFGVDIGSIRLFDWWFHFTPLGMLADFRAMKRAINDAGAQWPDDDAGEGMEGGEGTGRSWWMSVCRWRREQNQRGFGLVKHRP